MPDIVLSTRDRRIATLAAMRLPIEEIAKETALSVRVVSKVLSMPETVDYILSLRHRAMPEIPETQADTLSHIESDTLNTFNRLKALREQDGDLKVSLGACRELWGVQVPKRTTHDETHVTKIIIERRDMDRITAVRAEVKQIAARAQEEHGTTEEGASTDRGVIDTVAITQPGPE